MTFIVGLTGGIGSGKSSVGRRLEARGIAVFDTDIVARALTAPGGAAIPAIRAEFGDEHIDASGALDRAKMRALVFRDPSARRRLEAILHPRIRAETDRLVAGATSPYVVLMIPLLFESGRPRERCAHIVVVDCPEDVQVERVMKRDGLSREQVEAIMRAQVSRGERLAGADDVVDNGGDEAAVEPQVERLHRRLLALAGRASTP